MFKSFLPLTFILHFPLSVVRLSRCRYFLLFRLWRFHNVIDLNYLFLGPYRLSRNYLFFLWLFKLHLLTTVRIIRIFYKVNFFRFLTHGLHGWVLFLTVCCVYGSEFGQRCTLARDASIVIKGVFVVWGQNVGESGYFDVWSVSGVEGSCKRSLRIG